MRKRPRSRSARYREKGAEPAAKAGESGRESVSAGVGPRAGTSNAGPRASASDAGVYPPRSDAEANRAAASAAPGVFIAGPLESSAASLEADDPLALFDELLMEGRAPPAEAFCAHYPDHPSLMGRIRALEKLRGDLRRLAAPGAAVGGPPEPPEGFRLLRELGAGGMGLVYLGEQLSPRRLCALKFMTQHSREAAARFAREADLAARLSHPGIAAVFAFGVQDGRAYLATEYVHGFPLRALLRIADLAPGSGVDWLVEALRHLAEGIGGHARPSGPGPVPAMLELAVQIADALGHAHERGVVHRDVKPSNVMVTFDQTIKLIDFGIAISGDTDAARLTRTGAFVGSYDYAAPEQLRGEVDAMGPWSDTYALGATLFEMLTLRTPFECAGYVDRLALAGAAPPHGPRHFNSDVPPALDALVLHALDPEPGRRFQDGNELAEALRSCPTGPRLFPAIPRGLTAKLGLDRRSSWVTLIAILAAILFAALWGGERAERRQKAEQHARLARRAALDIFYWQTDSRQRDLKRCLPPVPSDATRGRHEPPPPPTRLAVTITVVDSRVTDVRPQSAFNLSVGTRKCIESVLRSLALPGVGLDGPVVLPVEVNVRAGTGEP